MQIYHASCLVIKTLTDQERHPLYLQEQLDLRAHTSHPECSKHSRDHETLYNHYMYRQPEIGRPKTHTYTHLYIHTYIHIFLWLLPSNSSHTIGSSEQNKHRPGILPPTLTKVYLYRAVSTADSRTELEAARTTTSVYQA